MTKTAIGTRLIALSAICGSAAVVSGDNAATAFTVFLRLKMLRSRRRSDDTVKRIVVVKRLVNLSTDLEVDLPGAGMGRASAGDGTQSTIRAHWRPAKPCRI